LVSDRPTAGASNSADIAVNEPHRLLGSGKKIGFGFCGMGLDRSRIRGLSSRMSGVMTGPIELDAAAARHLEQRPLLAYRSRP
jgi:hypothetical protein